MRVLSCLAFFALTIAGCDVFTDPVDPSWVPPPRPPRKERNERTNRLKPPDDSSVSFRRHALRNEAISVPAVTFRQEP